MGKIKNAFDKLGSNLASKFEKTKLAQTHFMQRAKDIMNSKAMKIGLPVLSIVFAGFAIPALGAIYATAVAAVAAETATVGSLTVASLMAAYNAHVVKKGLKGVLTLKDLEEDDQIREGLDQMFDLFRRRDLEEAGGPVGCVFAKKCLELKPATAVESCMKSCNPSVVTIPHLPPKGLLCIESKRCVDLKSPEAVASCFNSCRSQLGVPILKPPPKTPVLKPPPQKPLPNTYEPNPSFRVPESNNEDLVELLVLTALVSSAENRPRKRNRHC